MTPRPGFVGLKEGCRWCLCVERWKEALVASATMGERVVPRYVRLIGDMRSVGDTHRRIRGASDNGLG